MLMWDGSPNDQLMCSVFWGLQPATNLPGPEAVCRRSFEGTKVAGVAVRCETEQVRVDARFES